VVELEVGEGRSPMEMLKVLIAFISPRGKFFVRLELWEAQPAEGIILTLAVKRYLMP
jgi:hypothetical protein